MTQPPFDLDVLICGGGISGLALATWLDDEAIGLAVLDKNAEPGGVIATIKQDGFIFERGPNTVLDKFHSFDRLIEKGGLESAIIRVPMATQTRHVWLKGRLNEVPTGAGAFLSTPLLPPSGKLGLFREPFVRPVMEDESVADFVTRRLGPAWLRNLVTPMVTGIWAGDPRKLSIEHAFPIMKEMERDGGSIIRGAVKRMKRARKAPAGPRKRAKNLVSFREGLQQMPELLARRLGDRYHPATRIEAIRPCEQGGYEVDAEQDGRRTTWRARHLVVAAEADHAATWLESMDAPLAATLRAFPYNRLVVAAVGLRADEAHLPRGFGFLAPREEGLRILGAIVNSNFLPDRAPEGCAALTIFIGGDLDPAAHDLDDDALTGLLRKDLRTSLGFEGDFMSLHLERWPRGIPQYDMRHGERLAQIEAAEARRPGLHLMGNWRGGVSIGDRVEATLELARRIRNDLGRPAD